MNLNDFIVHTNSVSINWYSSNNPFWTISFDSTTVTACIPYWGNATLKRKY